MLIEHDKKYYIKCCGIGDTFVYSMYYVCTTIFTDKIIYYNTNILPECFRKTNILKEVLFSEIEHYIPDDNIDKIIYNRNKKIKKILNEY